MCMPKIAKHLLSKQRVYIIHLCTLLHTYAGINSRNIFKLYLSEINRRYQVLLGYYK